MPNKYRHKAGQYGNRDKLALAQEGTDALAPQIREQGFGVIDSIASAMLSAFPEDAHHLPLADTPEMTSLLSLLHLDKKFKTLGLHFTDEIRTPVTFISEIARLSKMNPILVIAAVMFHEQPNSMQSLPAPGIKRDADVRMAVVYCYLLHCITKIVIDEPIKTDLPEDENTFTQKLYEHFEELRKTSKWEEYFSTFENAKLVSVGMVFKYYALKQKTRIGFGPEKHFRGLALSINILEAMMQDIKLGYTNNAWCGFELMLEPGNRMLKGTGSTADYIWMRQDGRPSGVLCVCCPLPIIWNNLYMAWNLGFVADQYSDWPMFFAKLLNPEVVGIYNEVDPGLFMAPRVVSLYVHLAFMGLQRVYAKGTVKGPWKNELFNTIMGQVNREAGDQYRERIQEIVSNEYGPLSRLGYMAKRKVFATALAGVSPLISGRNRRINGDVQ